MVTESEAQAARAGRLGNGAHLVTIFQRQVIPARSKNEANDCSGDRKVMKVHSHRMSPAQSILRVQGQLKTSTHTFEFGACFLFSVLQRQLSRSSRICWGALQSMSLPAGKRLPARELSKNYLYLYLAFKMAPGTADASARTDFLDAKMEPQRFHQWAGVPLPSACALYSEDFFASLQFACFIAHNVTQSASPAVTGTDAVPAAVYERGMH